MLSQRNPLLHLGVRPFSRRCFHLLSFRVAKPPQYRSSTIVTRTVWHPPPKVLIQLQWVFEDTFPSGFCVPPHYRANCWLVSRAFSSQCMGMNGMHAHLFRFLCASSHIFSSGKTMLQNQDQRSKNSTALWKLQTHYPNNFLCFETRETSWTGQIDLYSTSALLCK